MQKRKSFDLRWCLPFASLQVRLVLLVLLAVLPALGLTLYTASEHRRLDALAVQASIQQLTQLASSRQEDLIEGARQLLVAFAQIPQVREGNPTRCNKLFVNLLKQYPLYNNFGAIRPDGTAFCSAIPLKGSYNLRDRLYFQRALKTRTFAIGDYQVGRITGKASINFAYPIFDRSGVLETVVFVALDLGKFNRVLAEIRLPPHSSAILFDRNGTILARSKDARRWVGQSLPEASLIKTILSQKEGTAELVGIDGVQRLYGFEPLRSTVETGLYTGVGIPRSVAYAEADRLLRNNLIGLGLVASISLLAAWLGGGLVVLQPLRRLNEATARLGAGDWSARSGLVHLHGELGELASAFDKMAQTLQRQHCEADALEARYRFLAEFTPQIVWTARPDGYLDYYNRLWFDYTGMTIEQTQGWGWEPVLHPEDLQRCVDRWNESVRTGEPYEIEYRFKRASDGTYRWHLGRAVPQHDETGRILKWFGTCTDIDDYKRAEQMLQEARTTLEQRVEERTLQLQLSESVLRSFYDSMAMMMGVVELVDDDIVYVSCNTFTASFFGRTSSSMHGLSARQMGDLGGFVHLWLDHYRNSEALGGPVHFEYDHDILGKVAWLAATVCFIGYIEHGRSRFSFVVEDITERKRAEEALEEANSQLVRLGRMSELLQTCVTIEEAFSVVAQAAESLFPGVSGSLFLVTNSRNLVEAVVEWGQEHASRRVFAPRECWALRLGRAHSVDEHVDGPLCPHLHHPQGTGHLCVPLIAQGEAFGVLYLCARDEFGESRRRLALTVAEQVALALSNLKLRATLQDQSIRDPLTGLFNRRYLEESLERELSRAERNGQPVGLIMLDVDHFKGFNDTFGHQAGDAVLKQLGRFLQSQVRGSDIVCRYGGEEFLLILPCSDLAQTHKCAEVLRAGVECLEVQHHGTLTGSVTISLGVASHPLCGKSAQALILAADEALYRAKRAGRNRVVAAEGTTAQPASLR